MSYLVLARKWRPTTFDELTGQGPIAGILKNALLHNKVAHAYIFSGPRGVGKTSTARILAKALNCDQGLTTEPCGKCPSCIAIADGSSMDVTEIDGASNTGVDNIRDLRERVRYASYGGGHKVYIIDEAHMLSTAAFNALLKTLEEPPPHVIFVLATTDPKKIPATVLSRCQHLPFRRISTQKIKERLKHIASEEHLKIADTALEMVARAADGSMRDSLTVLDQIASFSEDITAEDVKDLLGFTDMETLSSLAAAVIEGDRKGIVGIIADLTESGTDLKTFTKDYLQFMRDLLIAKIIGDTDGVMDLSEEEAKLIHSLAGVTNEEHLALLLTELIKAEPSIRSALFPRIALEMTLLRLGMMSHFVTVDDAIKMFRSSDPTKMPSKQIPALRTTFMKESPPKETKIRQAPKVTSAEDSPKGGSREYNREKLKKVPETPTAPQAHDASFAVPDTDMWNSVIEKIEEANAPLASKLREGSLSISNEGITILFNGGVAVLAESVKENISFLKETIKNVAGKSIPVRVETKEVKSLSKADLKEKALNNPVVREALELFDGRIVDISPINDKDNNS
jgi:DNA polymerase-3 subunit gamma/tau